MVYFSHEDETKEGKAMINTLRVNLTQKELIAAVKAMKKKEREALLEDLLAATSPEYLSSIREARADYKAGQVKSHEEVECCRR
jgi:hypothetical protein